MEVDAKRQRCADRFRRLSKDLIDDLEQGQSCKAVNSSRGCREKDAFDCSSILLGNASLALREAFGPSWRLEEAWAGSLTELYQKMKKIGSRLTGPSRICEEYDDYYSRERQNHHDCTKSTEFLHPMKPIYDQATVGLQLDKVGNAFYRELVEDQ